MGWKLNCKSVGFSIHVCDNFISLDLGLLSVTINYTTDLLIQSKNLPLFWIWLLLEIHFDCLIMLDYNIVKRLLNNRKIHFYYTHCYFFQTLDFLHQNSVSCVTCFASGLQIPFKQVWIICWGAINSWELTCTEKRLNIKRIRRLRKSDG